MSSGLNLGDWVMCVVCFNFVHFDDVYRDDVGQAWDVCSEQCFDRTWRPT